jgi:glycine oxidase
MADHPDILIIGGGVIGLTTAYYLARTGAKVHVVDQGDFGKQASWAGAGIIPPGDPARAQTPFDLLRAHSAASYPALSKELQEQTGIDNGYVVCGGVELLEKGAEPAAEEWTTEGITYRPLAKETLRQLQPGLHPRFDRGYHLPGMAQVRNPRHLKALLAACSALGVQLTSSYRVKEFISQGRRIAAVKSEQGRLSAGRFLIAAGAWSDFLLRPVGWRLGVRPVRGQIALLETGVSGIRPILLFGKRYLVPRTDGRVLVGSTEEDADFDATPTAGGIAELLLFAADLIPDLANARLERCWAGLRPGSPDGLPYLGAVPGCENLFVAAGHFRSGIQLSPVTGLVLKELLLGETPTVPLDAFRLDRPTDSSA